MHPCLGGSLRRHGGVASSLGSVGGPDSAKGLAFGQGAASWYRCGCAAVAANAMHAQGCRGGNVKRPRLRHSQCPGPRWRGILPATPDCTWGGGGSGYDPMAPPPGGLLSGVAAALVHRGTTVPLSPLPWTSNVDKLIAFGVELHGSHSSGRSKSHRAIPGFTCDIRSFWVVTIKEKSGLKILILDQFQAENCVGRSYTWPLVMMGEKYIKRGRKQALRRIFDHCEWSQYQKKKRCI